MESMSKKMVWMRFRFGAGENGGTGANVQSNGTASFDIFIREHPDRHYLNSLVRDSKGGYYVSVSFDAFLRAMVHLTDLRFVDLSEALICRQYHYTPQTETEAKAQPSFPYSKPDMDHKFSFGAVCHGSSALEKELSSVPSILSSHTFLFDQSQGRLDFLPGDQIRIGLAVTEGSEGIEKKVKDGGGSDFGKFMHRLAEFLIDDNHRQWKELSSVREPSLYIPDPILNHSPWKILRSPISPFLMQDMVMDRSMRERIQVRMNRVFDHLDQSYNLLLTGPSGSGKTSFVLALSTWFRADVYKITPGDEISNDRLEELISRIHLPDRPIILLLEDIESLFSRGNEVEYRSQRGAGFDPSTFLNILQGTSHAHGIVIVMTSTVCELNKLDSFLQRPGRMCEHYHFRPMQELSRTTVMNAIQRWCQRHDPLDQQLFRTAPDLYDTLKSNEEMTHVSLSAIERWIHHCVVETHSSLVSDPPDEMIRYLAQRSLPTIQPPASGIFQ